MWLPCVYLSRVSVNRKQPGIMGENYGFENRNGVNAACSSEELRELAQLFHLPKALLSLF